MPARIQDKRTTPANGWNYRQPESGAIFQARTWRQLIKKLRPHRLAMGYDTGTGWEERLEEDYIEQNPEMEAARPISFDDVKRCASTLKQWHESGSPLVSVEEAERRATICVSCPKNRKVAGCFGCAAAGTVLEWMVGERKTSQDEQLKSCLICGCLLKSKVLFPLEVTDNTGLKFPDWCWAREEAA